jgi:hypothetical protein
VFNLVDNLILKLRKLVSVTKPAVAFLKNNKNNMFKGFYILYIKAIIENLKEEKGLNLKEPSIIKTKAIL